MPESKFSQGRSLVFGLGSLLEHIAASCESKDLAEIPAPNILALVSLCGFDDCTQAETALRSHSYALYHNVLNTWPKDALFVKWLAGAVGTFRAYRLDPTIEERLHGKLQAPSPHEMWDVRPDVSALEARGPSLTPSDLPTRTARPLQTEEAKRREFVSPTGKQTGRRFAKWRFGEGNSDELHKIELQAEGTQDWVTEEHAHREFKTQLLGFWDDQGGRETAIEKAGGKITDNTKYLVYRVIKERRKERRKECLVGWVGYRHTYWSWERKSAIDS